MKSHTKNYSRSLFHLIAYLFKCVILLIFRAARHGLNMDGKLARLRKQDEQLLAVIKKTEEANSLTNKNK